MSFVDFSSDMWESSRACPLSEAYAKGMLSVLGSAGAHRASNRKPDVL